MALPDFTMRQLLEAGVHFGHQTHRWNPKMGSYIFGDRNGIHIIDLAQTVPLLHQALVTVRDVVAAGGRVLFVATKRQASDIVAESARRCAQYYINHRWLGGTLTNWKTISHSIKRLRQLEDMLAQEHLGLTKKETLNLTRERDKLERALGGIKDMGGIPDLMFVIDTNKEAIAIQEARKLGIPVVAIVDTNCDPQGISYPIPGNDDAGRAISLYCDLISRAALEGISVAQGSAGIDIGELENPLAEPALADEGASDMAEDADLGFPRLGEPRGTPDDLKKITGLGPTVEKKLNDLGIYHFWQIAEMNIDQIRALDDALDFKGRVERDDWAVQAKSLAGLDA
ncbi:30S ribosomal protein S2 [Rhodoligotrophos ferricapiens]|uniref:30S ribosomal protein S2 n=1 Tax=Rhodoligotrophos ferricapiens TaxID=3069264 RepID=UPI00315DC8AC